LTVFCFIEHSCAADPPLLTEWMSRASSTDACAFVQL
jgi:hypothetical protein